ncbi:MAG: ATP-dependent DNA helicase RecG [Gammaproteobacteria bacterium]|nr:ATP-dependent DNA helicase RecG [Gammaproteobacteria bacterium]
MSAVDPLNQPTSALYGVGEVLAEKLKKLGIFTVRDVLFHLPLRYEDRTRLVPISQLQAGQRASVEAAVLEKKILFSRRRNLNVKVTDDSGQILNLRFFHFSKSQQERFVTDAKVRCHGEVRRGRSGMEMIHPTCQVIDAQTPPLTESGLTPIYPVTEGLQQARIKGLSTQALNQLGKKFQLPDLLPAQVSQAFDWPNLEDALRLSHRPGSDEDLDALDQGLHPAQRRLAFEELLGHHLSLRRLREQVRRHQAQPLATDSKLLTQFLANLPFQLTGAQQRVGEEIAGDLVQPHPMMRLLQGDVGSGKTVVAAVAALHAIAAGYQAAIMAPTELLAEQHLRTFFDWFEPLGLRVVWLSGSLRSTQRRQALREIGMGRAQLVVGTHALFQEAVEFKNLALLIVDEQHRFGVQQRLELRRKGVNENVVPHQLVMTATPIPRTLAMTFYADLDCSVLDEMPPGRKPTQTVALNNQKRTEVIERVQKVLKSGQQAYWVCPLIEESDILQCQAAEVTAKHLREALPEITVGLVHGRLSAAEKESVMTDFKAKKIQLLVATTVIEVGVDVPDASLMVIENAERMGLAQLHQLRGRVGRGHQQSHCVLLYQPPLSGMAKQRLNVMRETNDGFEIARKDLQLRGAGEVLGTRQTGLAQMKIANLVRDRDLLPDVQQVAIDMLRDDLDSVAKIIARWIGHNKDYADV